MSDSTRTDLHRSPPGPDGRIASANGRTEFVPGRDVHGRIIGVPGTTLHLAVGDCAAETVTDARCVRQILLNIISYSIRMAGGYAGLGPVLMGGRLEASSTRGVGNVFRLTLPISQDHALPAQTGSEPGT